MDEFFTPENQGIIRKIVEFYHSSLKSKSKVLASLRNNGVTASDLERFKIGSSSGKIQHLTAGDMDFRDKISDLGFFNSRRFEIFQGYITFPAIDPSGVIHDIIGYKFKLQSGTEGGRIRYLRGKPAVEVKEESIQGILEALKTFSLKEVVQVIQAPASPSLPSPKAGDNTDGKTIIFQYGPRTYVVHGLNAHNPSTLRINLRISKDGINFRDTVDLYISRFREKLIDRVSGIFEEDKTVISRELEMMIEELEKIRLRKDLSKKVELTPEEKSEAVSLLKSGNLINMINDDLVKAGLAGEEKNRLMLYMAFTSRKLRKPLSVVVKGDSAGGKSYLVGQVLKLFPEEDIKNFTEITAKSLYYMAEDELAHKVLVIFERHGSENSDYSIRSLQSEECLKIAVTMKDSQTGEFRTVEKRVRGPVSYVETTTRLAIHPENATRSFDLFTDESDEQTERIYGIQNLEYLPEKKVRREEMEKLLRKHHNLQRALEPVNVKIPWVELVEFPKNKLRLRRDRMRFLALIETFAFLHQFQREKEKIDDSEYIIADLADYRMAYELAEGIMKDTLSVLHPKSRELLEKVRGLEKKELSISDIEEATGWHSMKIRRYIRQLTEEDYIEQKQGGNKGKRAIFALCSNKRPGEEKLEGLPSPDKLQKKVSQFNKVHVKLENRVKTVQEA